MSRNDIPAARLLSIAAVSSFLLNRRFTFDAKPRFAPGLARYYASVSIGLMLNALIVSVLIYAGLIYILAQVIATGLVLIWKFLAARFIVFNT
jgi:putative flippase GtrA